MEAGIRGKYLMQTMIVCEEIGELLEQLGLARKEKGFERLSYAIAVTAQEFERAGSVTKLLYPDLAKHFQTTPEKIERSLRHLIEKSWEKGEKTRFEELFGYHRDNSEIRPTNSEYIAILADWIRSGSYENGLESIEEFE
ncbi:MAG TPA: phosphoglycolate phosphatase [Lachnospiraceae bacterium]|jgi:sporulation transcription factor Spo0A|nr:phosphoglycolate phosphatase [Lachnospiraceae bacterium]